MSPDEPRPEPRPSPDPALTPGFPPESAAEPVAAARVIANNSAAGFVFFGVQLLTSLFALPIALHALGPESFGLISFVAGFAVFLQLVNLGLSIGLARFVGAFSTKQDHDELQSFVSDAYLVAIGGNLVVLVGMVLLGLFGAGPLGIDPASRTVFKEIAIVVGVTAGINGVLAVPRGILGGLQLTGLRTRRDLIGAVGPLIAALVVQFATTSLVLYTVIVQVTALIGGLLVLQATHDQLPHIRHVPARSSATLRRFASFSGLQVLNQAADIVFLASDRIVVQTQIGTGAVANYSIVERLQKLADAVVSIPVSAVIPASAQAWEVDDRRMLRAIVGSGTRLYLAMILPPLTVLIGLMEPFLRFWVGDQYAHLALAGQLFMLSLAGPAFVRVFAAVMAGKGRSRENVTAKLAFAPVNLAVSIVLASRLGVLGVIIPTTAYYVCIFPFVQFYLMRQERFAIGAFMLDVTPIILATLPVMLVLLIARPGLASASLLGLGVTGVGALALTYGLTVVLLRQNERAMGMGLLGSRLSRFSA